MAVVFLDARTITHTAKTDLLMRLARKGPVRARDQDEAGIPGAYLQRLCDRGVLERVDRGLYRLVDAAATQQSSLAEVAKRVPHASSACSARSRCTGLASASP